MKTIVLTFALISSVAAAADISPPTAPKVKDTPIQSRLEESVDHAWNEAVRIKDKAVEQAERVVKLAQATIETAPVLEPEQLHAVPVVADEWQFSVGMPHQSSAQPLIVRTSELEPETAGKLAEDLTVMSRILTKSLEQQFGRDGRDSAMGILLSTLPGSRRPQAVFLEGYGALFIVHVKFPLVPPPAKEDKKAERSSDSTWEEARRELYGERSRNVRVFHILPNDGATEYNAEQVEELREELVDTLKNAVNIRELKPEEFVTITVVGNHASGPEIATRRVIRGRGRGDVFATADSSRASVPESTLTIRAKKADIDAFASGDINAAEFKKRVAVATY